MAKLGKRLTGAYKTVDSLKAYDLDEAITLLKAAPKALHRHICCQADP